MKNKLIEKIIEKKEFSNLPLKDVEKIFGIFDREIYSDKEKVKKTRDLLRKVFSVFTSGKLLNVNVLEKKSVEEILRKHISTRERFENYSEIYSRLLQGFDKKKVLNVFDLGCGINGLSFNFLSKLGWDVKYFGLEAVGQLVDLMKVYFSKEKFNAKAFHMSLFDLERIKKLISKEKGQRVVFLFKVVDSLEMVERDYSKKFLSSIIPLVDRVVVSFATRSLVSRKKFDVKRYWFENFVKENFNVVDDFEIGSERYFVLENK